MKNKIKVLLLLLLISLYAVGCSKDDYGYPVEITYSEDEPRIENGTYIYPSKEVLYRDLDNGIVYKRKTDWPEMYLISIGGEDGLMAEFSQRRSDGVDEIKYFRLTPSMKQEFIDKGALFKEDGLGVRNLYSKVSFDTTEDTRANDESDFKYVVNGYIVKINSIERVVGPTIDYSVEGGW